MSMSSPATPTATFARRSSRGVLLGFSGWRLAALGAAGLLFLPFALSNELLLGVAAACPLVAAAFVRVAGLPATDWTPIMSVWVVRRLRGQTRYRAAVQRPRPAGTLALPGDAASLRMVVDTETGTCMVHDPYRRTLAATLRVTHPAYVLLAPDEKSRRVSMWGRAIASLQQGASCAGLQVLEQTLPDTGSAITDYYLEHGAKIGGWAQEQYERLLQTASTTSSTHRTTLTLSLDLSGASGQVKAHGGGLTGAVAVLRDEMRAMEYSLRAAELEIAGCWLGEAELAGMVRAAFDPAVGGAAPQGGPAGNLEHAGPLGMDEMWDRIHHDSGWSRVLWISEWPRTEAPAHFLHRLVFARGVRKTLCLSVRPKNNDEALRAIRKEQTDIEADQRQKRRIGQLQTEAERREWRDVQARESALVSGHADVDFTGWVVVTAATETQLEIATKQIDRAASHAGCETRVLFGCQAQGFIAAALPVGRFTR
ncbi:MAG TPA: SCO6880 family protein [Solirubrobacteraceae bacterium]